jgi:hypothetical protein
MIIKKKNEELKDNEKFITFDIGLAAAVVTLGYDLWDVDNTNQKKSKFIFRRDEHIDKMVQEYWDNKLLLPARSLLDNQKMLKNRLYSVMI